MYGRRRGTVGVKWLSGRAIVCRLDTRRKCISSRTKSPANKILGMFQLPSVCDSLLYSPGAF